MTFGYVAANDIALRAGKQSQSRARGVAVAV